MNNNGSKYYNTLLVASFVEMCCLLNIDLDDMYEFCSYIVGEKVDGDNINSKRSEIIEILQQQYPGIHRHYHGDNELLASEEVIDYYRRLYIFRYGNCMKINAPEHQKKLVLKNTTK